MTVQIIFAGASSVLSIFCFLPYLRDIFRGTTKPHSYTWFIWALLQAVVARAMWTSGAGFAIASSVIGAVLCALIFLLSLRQGTKHITGFDTICLVGALGAMAAYLFFHDALLSVIFATLTDFIGTLPTLRKSYLEPRTETASTHLLSSGAQAFALLALATFSVTTMLYVATTMVLDFITGVVVTWRSKMAKP
jgi:hypothetical protein